MKLHPRLPSDRFSVAYELGHCVVPLMPWSDVPMYWIEAWIDIFAAREAMDPTLLKFLDHNDANVGFVSGPDSDCTVLAITSEEGQDWFDHQSVPLTQCIWAKRGRYYLFDYAEVHHKTFRLPRGVEVYNDGHIITYPGSIYDDGVVAHWEYSPADCERAPFPVELFHKITS